MFALVFLSSPDTSLILPDIVFMSVAIESTLSVTPQLDAEMSVAVKTVAS